MTRRHEREEPSPEPKQVTPEQLKLWHDEIGRLLGWHGLTAQQSLKRRHLYDAARNAESALHARQDVTREVVLGVQFLVAELRNAIDGEAVLRRQAENERLAEEQAKRDAERERLEFERPDLYKPTQRRKAPTMTE